MYLVSASLKRRRQTRRFMLTTIREIRIVASRRMGKWPASVAWSIWAPRPMVLEGLAFEVGVFGED